MMDDIFIQKAGHRFGVLLFLIILIKNIVTPTPCQIIAGIGCNQNAAQK